MKQYLNILLSLFLTFTSAQPALAQTKVDGSLLKGDVIGGTASDTRRLVVPKDTKANLDAKTRLEANLVYGTDTKKAYIDNGTSLVAVGSGSGGAINLITDGDAENATSSIFVPYDDVGVAFPIDGTGGSPTVTTSITSTNPLTGAKSYLLTKPASVVQGQGWAIPFTVDPSYRAKVLKISLDYIVNSGTFTAGSATVYSDIIWYVYDITNSTLIEPSSTKMLSNSSTLSDKFEATFQTSATGSSYRLIAHMATGFSTAFELKVDNVTVSPSVYVYGTPITDSASYTTTLSNATNATVDISTFSRNGDRARIKGFITWAGAGAGSTFTVSLPSGLSIDTLKIKPAVQGTVLGLAQWLDNGTARKGVNVLYNTATSVQFEEVTSSSGPLAGTGFASGDTLSYDFEVPIVGWSSSVQMSDSADTRVVAMKVFKTSNQSLTSGVETVVTSWGVAEDTHGAFNTTTGIYTAPIDGWYEISGQVAFAANATGQRYTRLAKNGSSLDYGTLTGNPYSGGDTSSPFAFLTKCTAGTTLSLVAFQNSGGALNIDGASNTATHISIKRVTGPSAIAANESVNAVYTTAAGQSIPNATDTIIDFGTAEINSHGNVTTGAAWKFTAQISGVYEVSAYIQFLNGGSWNTAEDGLVSIFKNGSNFTRIGNTASTATHGTYVPIPCAARQIRLLAGDYIDLRAYQTSGSALGLAASSTLNWVSIKRVGN